MGTRKKKKIRRKCKPLSRVIEIHPVQYDDDDEDIRTKAKGLESAQALRIPQDLCEHKRAPDTFPFIQKHSEF